jgi:hypothetical protein
MNRGPHFRKPLNESMYQKNPKETCGIGYHKRIMVSPFDRDYFCSQAFECFKNHTKTSWVSRKITAQNGPTSINFLWQTWIPSDLSRPHGPNIATSAALRLERWWRRGDQRLHSPEGLEPEDQFLLGFQELVASPTLVVFQEAWGFFGMKQGMVSG